MLFYSISFDFTFKISSKNIVFGENGKPEKWVNNVRFKH